jgi:hypothetical protein
MNSKNLFYEYQHLKTRKLMQKYMLTQLLLLSLIGANTVLSQSNSLEDVSIAVSVDQRVYFFGDTIRLSIRLMDSTSSVKVTPMLTMEGMKFKPVGNFMFTAVIPPSVTPESYRVFVQVVDSIGQFFFYKTNCFVNVEELQGVEQVEEYVRMGPDSGSDRARTAVTLDRGRIRKLRVIFDRNAIRHNMGPQFVTIQTTVMSREEKALYTFERRVLTFRSCGDPNRDRVMFAQYRTAYGGYAAILPEELEQVNLQLDSLPSWTKVKVHVEPDYTIKIGAYDRLNSFTRYYRVKGPKIVMRFALAIPKVLYDTQAKDTIQYGKSSAMIRFYYVNAVSGHRFPVNLGFGTFGVNSPIDVGVGQGGFAVSILLDVVELIREFGLSVSMKANAGIEITPFFPIQKKSRLLLNAQVGLSI